jgi:hypothetical protein
MPREARVAGARLLAAVMAVVPQKARFLAHLVRVRTLNRFQDEIVSLAHAIHADWRDVMFANITYDLLIANLGCSTAALATPSGPVVARNMDWQPEDILAQASYLVQYQRKGVLQFASAGWPGATGVVTGMSRRGFAVVLNAVDCPEAPSRLGYPVLLHLRRVLEDAPDFDGALHSLSEQRLTVSALFTLVGSENRQRVVIERSPTRCALRWPNGDEPLLTTNDYRLLFQSEIQPPTCSRYDALCEFFADQRPDREIEDDALLYVLTDPRVIQDITAQHIIMRPRSLKTRLFVPRRFVSATTTKSPAHSS